ncbi:MAG: UPF0182 family protein [Chloroflexi bacterium]|nr:UPF0182 family protein [Chloroflexota bacterium]
MRDLFDDFMDELRKREAASRGEVPDRGGRPDPSGDDDGDDDGVDPVDGNDDGNGSDTGGEDAPRPRSIDDRPRTRRGPRSGGPGGPNDGGNRAVKAGRRFGLSFAIVGAFVLFLLFSVGLDLWTDALWYLSVGFDSVFFTQLSATFGLFVGAFVLSAVVLLANLWLAGRLTPPPAADGRGTLRSIMERINDAAQSADQRRGTSRGPFGDVRRDRPANADPDAVVFDVGDLPDLTPLAGWALGGMGLLVALVIGGSVSGAWETVLLWANRVPFSATATVTDPIFNRDISFFLFELPFLRLVQGVFNGLVIASLLIALARYLIGATSGGLVFATPVRVHLGVLGALFLLSVAFGYQLDKLELVYSTRGIATGVSFTDQNAQFAAFDILTFISGIAAALLVGGAFTRSLWPLGLTISVWFLASLLVGRIYPEAVQRFTVEPNQFAQEERYIGNNIAMTRLAFGLDSWTDRAFGGNALLTAEDIELESDTFRSARLWDYRPLSDTIDQLQRIRRYYTFTDVDTDRYVIDGVKRQVMLSARELDLSQNPTAVGWVNERIVFTHGVGAAMVPVNEVSNEGQPRLFIRDLPPISSGDAPPVTEPRIYFGERPSGYVVVGARQKEFDFPSGSEGDPSSSIGTQTSWTGTTGITLDSTLNRLLFAARFRDLNLLISDQVTQGSQLLFHRSLSDRLGRIAPFLRFDKDPYIVIDDAGRMVYVQDAFTTSDWFPNAEPFSPQANLESTALGNSAFNYIRNSVKITMDAYDGTMHFYINDPNDPIIRAYAGVFPELFESIDNLPDDLRAHLRVPEELFNVQTRVFGRYHVTDAQQFFRGDDLWTVPQGQGSEQSLPDEAYYVVMRLPGEEGVEFTLLQPMVPTLRPNMIAWVAARMDQPNYGQTLVYRFPSDTTVFGPAQIEARIDQDPLISQQISLWNQSGSKVIRGNLIVLPINDALIYLQPIYLQSTGSAFPEFQRIVVASPRQVVWGETLAESLNLLLAGEAGAPAGPLPTPQPSPGPSATPGPTPGPTATAPVGLPSDVQGLVAYANTHFELAQEALRDGDFATYGTEIALVETALRQLQILAPGLVAPSPGASTSPAP